jgi:hypothetical protein
MLQQRQERLERRIVMCDLVHLDEAHDVPLDHVPHSIAGMQIKRVSHGSRNRGLAAIGKLARYAAIQIVSVVRTGSMREPTPSLSFYSEALRTTARSSLLGLKLQNLRGGMSHFDSRPEQSQTHIEGAIYTEYSTGDQPF